MEIIGHTVGLLDDPFGLLEGDRYEFFLHIDVEQDDDLYSENGLRLKVIFSVGHAETKILQYYFVEKSTDKILEFALEEDEEAIVTSYCSQNIPVFGTE